MRIVQIIPSFGMGGAETMCAALSRQLLLDGHQVSAISLSGEKTVISQRLEASGVPVYYLDKALGSGLQCVGQLKKLLKTLDPQLIHTHLHALKYAALASSGVPIVHTIHNQAAQEAVFLDKQIGKYCFRPGPGSARGPDPGNPAVHYGGLRPARRKGKSGAQRH